MFERFCNFFGFFSKKSNKDIELKVFPKTNPKASPDIYMGGGEKDGTISKKSNKDIELEVSHKTNPKASPDIYMGGGEKNGTNNFFHIVFDSKDKAMDFCKKLEKEGIKLPTIHQPKPQFHLYPSDKFFIRIHKTDFETCKQVIKNLPTKFEDLKPYSSSIGLACN